MPRLRCCLSCFVELDRIALADGSVVLMCAPCDTIGVEREIAIGGRMWIGGTAQKPSAARPRRHSPALR